MNIHFQLRQQGASNPVIILNVFDSRFEQRKFMYSTGISIDKNHWDKRRDRAKLILAKTKEYEELNKYLDHIQQAVISFLSERYKHDSLSRTDLKVYINSSRINERDQNQDLKEGEDDFFNIWEKIINESKTKKGVNITDGTKTQKRQTLKLVQKFCAEKKVLVSFTNLDMVFYREFNNYMEQNSLNGNTRGRHVKEIKALFREAMDRDIQVNLSFQKKSFKVIRNETDNTYLNDYELKKLIELKLPLRLSRHRDIFTMACFVGARHSDWDQISEVNIVRENKKDLLKIRQTKTRELVHIPVHPVVRMILNKYDGVPPKVTYNHEFNEVLKEIGKLLDLGNVMVNGSQVEKWQYITTHTARRSFATNAYLSKSLEVYQIMKCTGHKTELSFLAYLKLNGRDYAMEAAESKFFNNDYWTESIMKVS